MYYYKDISCGVIGLNIFLFLKVFSLLDFRLWWSCWLPVDWPTNRFYTFPPLAIFSKPKTVRRPNEVWWKPLTTSWSRTMAVSLKINRNNNVFYTYIRKSTSINTLRHFWFVGVVDRYTGQLTCYLYILTLWWDPMNNPMYINALYLRCTLYPMYIIHKYIILYILHIIICTFIICVNLGHFGVKQIR